MPAIRYHTGAIAALIALSFPVETLAQGFGEIELRFGTGKVDSKAGNPRYAHRSGADQDVTDLSLSYQMPVGSKFGVQFDLDHTHVDNNKINSTADYTYGATALTAHAFTNINEDFTLGAFAMYIAPNTYDTVRRCDNQEHVALGIEGQYRMANGVVIDALYGHADIGRTSECEGRHWDNADFIDLNLTVPITSEWSLTSGYFQSGGIVSDTHPAERSEVRIGAQYTPEGSNWTFLTEASFVDYHQKREGDRSEIASLYFGVKFEFGGKPAAKRPLLNNAARPMGRAIALSHGID